jgi:hypothetical protein
MNASCQQIGFRQPTKLLQLWQPLRQAAFEGHLALALRHQNRQLGHLVQDYWVNFQLLQKHPLLALRVYFEATMQRLKLRPHQGLQLQGKVL